ncbi:MAG TPA: hypothetical protein VNJ10_01920 [Sphingomonas sp.]|nr:hypothetical protein [Sphingomonas sp.]
MIKLAGVIVAIVLTAPAAAQTAPEIGMSSPNYSTYQSSLESLGGLGAAETPTMRAYKMKQAIALQTEAADLLRQDGGTFTAKHEEYIRGKACDILGVKRTSIGSLVPRRGCGL